GPAPTSDGHSSYLVLRVLSRSSGAHRGLHSFPTRRSSDLPRPTRAVEDDREVTGGGQRDALPPVELRRTRRGGLPALEEEREAGVGGRGVAAEGPRRWGHRAEGLLPHDDVETVETGPDRKSVV